ncbi:methyltransferase family protein [Gordonia crocea]|uniref:Phospholipid methyltransferase n=1 Tax=Gordonia crocea TaxID=589162 RepID=A0A7I9UY46_9ACTN|nr:methyltransferase [Gordonia crocea]GED97730.1 hypothetical protein nbrc107697_17690 [Gordonia crocea]
MAVPEIDVAVLRPLIVVVPVIAAGVLWLLVTDPRRRGAAVLALVWNLIGLAGVNAVAVSAGWWRFADGGPAVVGVPVDLLVAWAVAWSMIPVLGARWLPLPYSLVALVLVDVYGMSALAPAVVLRADWWWGELLAVSTCLVPGAVLAGLTVRRRALGVRVGMQVLLFTAVLFAAIPVLGRAAGQRGPVARWADPAPVHVGGTLDSVAIQIGGLIAVIALAAVIEFYRAGGTPWPWDPPDHLVTTGPYAYVANPMQLCGTLLIVVTAVVTAQPLLLVAAGVAAAFSSGMAAWVEADALGGRFGREWTAYRGQVRDWIPRWRPAAVTAPARVYLARGCDPCSDLAAWIVRRSPVGLAVCAAEDHPADLRRIRYESAAPEFSCDGVRAVGEVLARVNLAWAVVGWVIATPGISRVLQLLVDACGGGPRDLPAGRNEDGHTPSMNEVAQ